MKKWIIPALAGFTLAPLSNAADLAYLYNDMRIMGMGGANIASGGYSSSVFANPAGIANLAKDHGLIVELLGINLTASADASDIVSDLTDAIDSDNEDEIIDVLEKYSGERTHIDVANYSSVSINHGNYAWSVGLLAATDVNLTPHANSIDGILEVQSRGYGGIIAAYTYTIENVGNGDLQLGLGAKYLFQKSFEGKLTPADLLNGDDIGDEIRDRMEKDSDGYSIDLGAIYQFDYMKELKPAIGLSIMNIGSLDFDDSYGGQPTTVNIGASIEPNIPFIKKTRIALDYVDVFNANEYRLYDLDVNDVVSYSDYEDSDFMKRLRFGISGLIYDNSWSSLEIATGIYQGGLTAGIDFTASVFRLGFATYEEQTGPEHGDESDRRYSLNLSIAW
ncbi:conjugal transfer protein TraF [Colwellia psychrerythraea]|uniref:Uncharacterized protein n=1 Tax=Colwellia psychrerythraea TaxID=28229 RepID=A0A099KGL9_COLPS|nr:conjugal transfer protein TraF [Colwellia psychrerythraea]KGJ89107.1 hypothetical protein GAB14E_4103 [Colwellia psychrerythraea]